MSRLLGRALGSVVSPIVEFVDVDGVVQRINVDDIVQRVDMDALLDHVDINRQLDRVDLNRHLDRVDMDALLARVDIQELVNRSDIAAIITQSSTGVFTGLMDAFRIQLALLDQWLYMLARCKCKNPYEELPPAPGIVEESKPYPPGSIRRALAVQGRSAGVASFFTAWFIDGIFIALVFAVGVAVFDLIWSAIIDEIDIDTNSKAYATALFVWGYVYTAFSLAFTGRTLGKAMTGLLVVGSKGKRAGFLQIVVYSLWLSVSIATVFGLLLFFVGRDRKMFHEYASCCCEVYSWDAKAARIRENDVPGEERVQAVFSSSVIKGEKPPV